MIIRRVRETMSPGREVAHWTIIDMTQDRSKTGSIIWKCKNNITRKIEYKSGAYLVQYLKRKSQKTFLERHRYFVRIPLEEFQEFATNLNFICPKLFRYIKDAKINNLKDIGMLFETTKDCAEYGTTAGRARRVAREREEDRQQMLRFLAMKNKQ